jgi:hypothetical protein
MTVYKILRFYKCSGRRRVIKRGLSLEEAQAHCRNPQTSSRTAKGLDAYTRRVGPWFDGYEEEDNKKKRK